jgi:hypothetical protein
MTRACIGACAVFALAGAAAADFVAAMPPQTGTFVGSTRGYFFTAPVDFKMTGVKVLVANGLTHPFMNFAVLRFDGATPPPAFPGTTNAFTSLAGGVDQPTGNFIPVNLDIHAGDVIGVYGNTMASAGASSGTNSYANAPGGNTTEIFGNSVQLFRSGMQFHLGSLANPNMHDVWREGTSNTSNITRVEFTYLEIPGPASAALLAFAGLAAGRRRR